MPDSLLVELGFRIPVISGIPDSLRFITDSKAHDSRFHKSNFPHSGFPYMGQTLGIGAWLVADPGEGPGGGEPPPLFVDQIEARRAEKFFFREPPPFPLIKGSGWPPPPTLISKSGSGTACLPKYWQADISKGSIWDLENNYILHLKKKQKANCGDEHKAIWTHFWKEKRL